MSQEDYDDDDKENTAEDEAKDQSELVNKIIKNIAKGEKHLGQWRDEAQTDYDNYAGNQWSEEDALKLAQEGRVPIVFNRTMRIINAICGLEVQNRQEVRLYPRRTNSAGFADAGNDAMKWVRDNCDAEDEDSEAFRDATICGYGYTETYMDYECNPDGDIKIIRRDPLEIFYDPSATKKNLADMKWICHKSYLTREEIEDKWGEEALDDFNGAGSDGQERNESNTIIDNPGNQYATGERDDERDRKGKIPVFHYQEYTVESLYKVPNPFTGQVETLTEEQYKEVSAKAALPELRFVKVPTRKYTKYIILGRKILEQTDLSCNSFTFNVITGFYDRNNNTYFGLCKVMRDPQMWSNKFFSQILHIINSNAKGGLIFESGVLANPAKAMNEWARPDSAIEVTPGGLGRLQQKEAPAYPAGLDKLMTYAQSSINDVTGVSLEFLGQANRDQPYVLEYQRQKQGTLIFAPLFDSNRRYRKTQGRLICKYIQDYVSDGRLIRVLGPEGAQYIPLLRDNLAIEYDVVVDDAPTSPNVKERVFEVLMQIIPLALQSGIPIPPDVLDFAPIPDNLVQKWKQRIQYQDPLTQQMRQIQATMMQLQADKLDIENRKTAADISQVLSTVPLNQAKAAQANAASVDIQSLAAERAGANQYEVHLMQQKFQYEQALKEVELMLENERKVAQMQIDAHLDTQRVQADINNKQQMAQFQQQQNQMKQQPSQQQVQQPMQQMPQQGIPMQGYMQPVQH